MKSLIALSSVIWVAQAAFQPLGVPFKSPVTVAAGFAARVIFSNLTAPRGITFDSEQNLLVVERGVGITAFSPVTSPSAGWERTIVAANTDLTQGIQVDGSLLYVSTATEVIVYQYDSTTRTIDTTFPPYPIVTGVPGDGGLLVTTIFQLSRSEMAFYHRIDHTYAGTRKRWSRNG